MICAGFSKGGKDSCQVSLATKMQKRKTIEYFFCRATAEVHFISLIAQFIRSLVWSLGARDAHNQITRESIGESGKYFK